MALRSRKLQQLTGDDPETIWYFELHTFMRMHVSIRNLELELTELQGEYVTGGNLPYRAVSRVSLQEHLALPLFEPFLVNQRQNHLSDRNPVGLIICH